MVEKTYTGVSDVNGNFNVSFNGDSYTSGEKVVVTAEKFGATKSIELYAPSEPVPPVISGFIVFSGNTTNFPSNVGVVTVKDMTMIGNSCFYSSSSGEIWSNASGLVISNGVTEISHYAFFSWIKATSLTLPNTLTSIGYQSFYNWNKATSLTLPSSVVTLDQQSFNGWSAATSITFLAPVSNIPNSCFYGWSECLSLELPSGVSIISDSAFYNWNKAKSLTLPATITSLAESAFYYWSSCDVITVNATTPPTIKGTTFGNLKSTCIFKVPAASVAAYQAAPNWSAFAARIQAI